MVGAGSFPIGSSSPRCILLSVLANRFASYLRTGLYVIAFHIVDLDLRLAVRSVLSAENQPRDQYKPVTAIGTM